MIEVGDVVRDIKWDGQFTGTVVRRLEDYVFVQWHGSCVEDEMHESDVVPAPEVPNPQDDGFQPLVFGG